MTAPIEIPRQFLDVPYNGVVIPGSRPVGDLSAGANCQVFAYAILSHFGIDFPPLRSSELWTDTTASVQVDGEPRPLDLLLVNRTSDPFGRMSDCASATAR